MPKVYKLGFRKKGQKTWKPITVNLGAKGLKRIRQMYKKIPKNMLPHYGVSEDAIFSARQVKRFRKQK